MSVLGQGHRFSHASAVSADTSQRTIGATQAAVPRGQFPTTFGLELRSLGPRSYIARTAAVMCLQSDPQQPPFTRMFGNSVSICLQWRPKSSGSPSSSSVASSSSAWLSAEAFARTTPIRSGAGPQGGDREPLRGNNPRRGCEGAAGRCHGDEWRSVSVGKCCIGS